MIAYTLVGILVGLVVSKWIFYKCTNLILPKGHKNHSEDFTDYANSLSAGMFAGMLWPVTLLVCGVGILGYWWLKFDHKKYFNSKIAINIEKNNKENE